MKILGRAIAVLAVAALFASAAAADELFPQEEERTPGAALAAAAGNIVFLPVRMAISLVGGGLGAATGFMTAGNYDAADDVWHLFRGHNILTPEIVQGKEAPRFGDLEFNAGGPPS